MIINKRIGLICLFMIMVLFACQSDQRNDVTNSPSGGSSIQNSTQVDTKTDDKTSAVESLYNHISLGDESERNGDIISALEHFNEAIRIDKDNAIGEPEGYYRIALIQNATGNLADAEQSLIAYVNYRGYYKKRISRNIYDAYAFLGSIERALYKDLVPNKDVNKLNDETCDFSSNGQLVFVDGIVVLAKDADLPVGTTICINGSERKVVGNRPVLRYPGNMERYPVLDSGVYFSPAMIGNCVEVEGEGLVKGVRSTENLPEGVRVPLEEMAKAALKENIDTIFTMKEPYTGYVGLHNYVTKLISGEKQPNAVIQLDVYESNGYAYGEVFVDYYDTIDFEPDDYRAGTVPDGKVSKDVQLAVAIGAIKYHADSAGEYTIDQLSLNYFKVAWSMEEQASLGGGVSYSRNVHSASDMDNDGKPELYVETSHYESYGGRFYELDLVNGTTSDGASFGCGY